MQARRRYVLTLPRAKIVLGPRTLLMGVLNVTPDSFSDGGRFLDPDRAAAHALAMQRAGADLIDIGGESTRPGSAGVSAAVELRRVLPVLRRLRGRLRVPISIDPAKADVAEAALQAGAQMINDTSGLRADRRLAEVARRHRVPLVLMHIRGTPRTMQKISFARNILRDVDKGLRWSVRQALHTRLRPPPPPAPRGALPPPPPPGPPGEALHRQGARHPPGGRPPAGHGRGGHRL